MSKIKLYLVPLILIYNLLSISVSVANNDINFNLGKSINEDLISKIDNLDSKFLDLNLDKELHKETILKINSNNKINSFKYVNIKNNNSLNQTTQQFKKNEINWHRNNLDKIEIQKRILAQDISISPTS